MIDGDQREAPTPGESGSEPDADEKGADETRASCYRNHLDRPTRHFERLVHEKWQGLEMFARGKFRNNAPVGCMRRYLAGQQAHLDPSGAINDRDGTLVTGGLDAYCPKQNDDPNSIASPKIKLLTRL